ncbi:hypothetical protein J6590_090336, partial [Homalodisca vitripennis]
MCGSDGSRDIGPPATRLWDRTSGLCLRTSLLLSKFSRNTTPRLFHTHNEHVKEANGSASHSCRSHPSKDKFFFTNAGLSRTFWQLRCLKASGPDCVPKK